MDDTVAVALAAFVRDALLARVGAWESDQDGDSCRVAEAVAAAVGDGKFRRCCVRRKVSVFLPAEGDGVALVAVTVAEYDIV
jgi:hypothetical protein